ncbi:MAG: hypothetical protein B6I22_12530 [Desulfobacteraceae bacterium 4572_123]|nr:MAG: hypothetical protein B6I22_12530 [Desulfobacteraceae bacterium 4572_123]
MPGFDRTGPRGAGPMTGGARGYCNPATRAAAANAGFPGGAGYGRGYGRGNGRGFGRGYGAGYGRGYYPPQAAPYYGAAGNETADVKAEADDLKRVLDTINERLAALEKTISK